MRIRPLYFSDEIFYWARSGRQATVIELHCTFAQKVDPEVLEKALSNALQVHLNEQSLTCDPGPVADGMEDSSYRQWRTENGQI